MICVLGNIGSEEEDVAEAGKQMSLGLGTRRDARQQRGRDSASAVTPSRDTNRTCGASPSVRLSASIVITANETAAIG